MCELIKSARQRWCRWPPGTCETRSSEPCCNNTAQRSPKTMTCQSQPAIFGLEQQCFFFFCLVFLNQQILMKCCYTTSSLHKEVMDNVVSIKCWVQFMINCDVAKCLPLKKMITIKSAIKNCDANDSNDSLSIYPQIDRYFL